MATKKKTKAIEPKPVPTIIDLCRDPDFFADWFKDEKSWRAWFTFLRVLFALPLDDDDLALFKQCTGQSRPNPNGYLEADLLCGRRAGKSIILALIAVYLACFRDYRPYLVKNERAVLMIISADRKQAQSIFRYIKGFLSVPLLESLIERETAEVIELFNSVSIEVTTASGKTLRGRTVAVSLNDESCFWNTDDGAANPDTSIFEALKPAMATIPGAMLFKASSPYSKKGSMYEDFQRYYGVEGSPVLVWKSPTWVMNPSVPQAFIDEQYERDPQSAAAELGAEWRTDISGFLDLATIQAAVDNDVSVRPPNVFDSYVSFCDMSGGSSDSATMAIAHFEHGVAVLDHVTEIKSPHSPSDAVGQIAAVLKLYGLSETTGDRYASGFTIDAFAAAGITYLHSERDRSTIYNDVLSRFNSGAVRLLDLPRLVTQLASLERKSMPGGRSKIEHPRNQRDDVANAASGALVLASAKAKPSGLIFASIGNSSAPTQYHVDSFDPYGTRARGGRGLIF